ncbi:MAG: hypothetical protein IRY95_06285, partial [Clostridia bacterium]|nr:hypothetical protein [Clostridia bacterium]
MAIRFERREKVTRYLDPRNEHREVRIRSEVRWDPLTRRTARVAHFVGFRLRPVDFSQAVEASRAVCPFCPERILEVTPRFPPDIIPDGRVHRGETVVFPNLSPYDEHSAVAAISREHYIPLDGFRPQLLMDAFLACIDYFRHVSRHPGTTYSLVNWNY